MSPKPFNSLRQTHPHLVEEFHPSKNGDLTPDNISAGFSKKIHWKCKTCSHEWVTTASNRKRGTGCNVCNRGGLHSDGRNSMRKTHPALAEEFHPTKNAPLTPDTVIATVSRKLHWFCGTCSHEWATRGEHRVAGSGCPACAGQVVHIDGRNSIKSVYPELVEEFHLAKNEPFTPDNLPSGTARKLHWICRTCSHEWRAVGAARANGTGCGVCNRGNFHSDGRNSMRNTHPHLAEEFHPTKNGKMTPDNTIAGTNRRLHWICNTCSNEWISAGANRSHGGKGCPSCNLGRLHSDGRNSMRNTHPHLAEEFHPTKNADLTPDNLVAGTREKLHWICSTCSHEWENFGYGRAGGEGCAFCNAFALHSDGRNSMANTHPELVMELHPTRNGDFDPNKVVAGTHNRLHWMCRTCSNEWVSSGNERTHSESGCSSCNLGRLHSDGRNSMRNTHPHLAEEFHPTKNGDLTPDNLVAGSNKSLHWICSTCSHEWETTGNSRGFGGTGCGVCNKGYLHEDGRNSMRNTHPQLAEEFHPTRNGDLTPDNLIAGTNLILHWICSTCSHEWAAGGSNRSTSNNPSGCGVCYGGALHSDGRNSMRNTHPNLAEEFHPTKNGAYTPDNLKASTQRRVFWICSICSHEWKTTGGNRTTGGTGCPLCCDFGFQLDKPGYYYVHEIINMDTGDRLFYKGGISNDWEGRFAKIRRGLPEGMSIHNIEHILFERGEQALALESTLLGIEEIRAPVRSFDGGTELFLFHPLEYARTHGHLS